MNRNDVIDVLSVVAAATRRSVGEADVAIWEPVIGSLPKDLALQAVRDHIRDSPGVWLEPGHVYQRARAIRRDEMDRDTWNPPIESGHTEHYPGDEKAGRDLADYPAGWTPEQRIDAYWYAMNTRAVPHTTAGWEAIARQLERKRDERAANA
jgi:hypothetical protein